MNFFEQQDIARRNTRVLVVLFVAAVLLLIVLTNAAVAGYLWFGQDYNVYSGGRGGLQGFLGYFSWARFGGIGLAVSATVAMVALVKWWQLSTGGKVVAESMGGTLIVPATRDAAERRCLNVVQEIALAANMPVPPVYVLNDERGINAFAAGISPADAVVAVTRGTIDHLKRHELQGVIAHEFSHILNGDMRLNIRLAALLKGITFIGDVGHILLRSSNRVRSGASERNGNGAMMPMLGLALWLLGLVGAGVAGFIKAAISRQKEYLADASAVQFTRSPDGIGDALKVIGGYIPGTLVHAARAQEMSHIFFGEIEHRLWHVFATHPPLASRIRRVDPTWNGEYIQRDLRQYGRPDRPLGADVGVGRAAIVAAAFAAAAGGQAAIEPDTGLEDAAASAPDADFDSAADQLEERTAERAEIPVAFVRQAQEPLGAQALVCCLLIHPGAALRQAQLATLAESGTTGLTELVTTLAPGVRELGAPRRLPLLELCLPALKAMSAPQFRLFKRTLLLLIRADGQTELHEWCLYQLVRHYLDPQFIQVKPSRPRYRSLHKVAYHLRVVLSVLAHEGSGETAAVFRLAADELDLRALAILPREQCSVAAFSRAVHELADCYPLLKPRVLKAMALAAGADGRLNPAEREIIASMAAVMDCPVPVTPEGIHQI
ncbi:MAG: M48 family metallopeptidase [Pseudomonadales bacterium]|nr:M48 family metallopeptidase [Pseudomonadales bacterium]